MKLLSTVSLAFLLALPALGMAAEKISAGTYQADHRYAVFQIRVSGSRFSGRGKNAGGGKYSSWKPLALEDKGKSLRLTTPGYVTKIKKSSIKDSSFKGTVASGGQRFGRLTFKKQ